MKVYFNADYDNKDRAILDISNLDLNDTILNVDKDNILHFRKLNIDLKVIEVLPHSAADFVVVIVQGDKEDINILHKNTNINNELDDEVVLVLPLGNVKPVEKGLRYNAGKLPIHLVPVSAITGLAEVLEFGAKKYSADQWRKGLSWSETYGSAMRHLLKWKEGEDRDAESGLHHLKHVLTNIAFLVEFLETHPELDDRSKNEKIK